MFKRVTIVTLVVAAFVLMAAVPAMAWNGYRGDYTTTQACAQCHSGIAGIPAVYPQWSGTKHAIDEEADSAALSLPYGSVCAGCHTANYDPAKVIPVPTATSGTGAVSWAASPSVTSAPQTEGNAPFSENQIGCSSCHYGEDTSAGGLAIYGSDPNNSAHMVPYGNMADAQICGACHSRYSYTTNTYTVQPVPYLTVVAGSPVPNPNPTTLIQPQMAIGYPLLGSPSPAPAWSPVLSSYLNIPSPTWSPTPNPAATTAGLGRMQTYWRIDGVNSPWQQTGHEGGDTQYPEWANDGLMFGHSNALKTLQGIGMANDPECLKCHSADYRIMTAAGKDTSKYTAKYGVTCVGCHTPHDAGKAKGIWDDAFDSQLVGDPANPSDVCTQCHNGELPVGSTATPGAEIHHPMKEMMDGYGAIDVAAFPSVHKGKCVQCHMPPTTLSRGSVQLGGNHTYNIITPKEANDASPIPYATATAVATTTPSPTSTVVTTTLTVTQDSMPYSACSTCHNKVNASKKTPEPVSTTTATPAPGKVTVTIVQNANQSAVANMTGGDKGLWLQDTIDQRQSWTHQQVDQIWVALQTAANKLGYAPVAGNTPAENAQIARDALVAISANKWTTAERAFLSGFTNVEFVDSEGSYGLHNWDYSREIVNKAMEEALIAQTGVVVKLPYKVTLALSKSNVKAGAKVKFSGSVMTARGVAGAGTVKLMKLVGGVWKVWKGTSLDSSGKYSLTVKLTKKGTFHFRALMPADSLNKAGNSGKRKLVVK